jgi:formate dehydrogenase major subunit
MMHAMDEEKLTALYVIGENPAQSDADMHHVTDILERLDHLVVQEIFLTKTAQMATVVFPASATWAEGEGDGHEQRAPRAALSQSRRAAGRRARRDLDHVRARTTPRLRLGASDGRRGVERAAVARTAAAGDELQAPRGARRHSVAVSRRVASGNAVLARALWDEDPAKRGRLAPFSVVHHEGPSSCPTMSILSRSPRAPLGVVQHRCADGGYLSPLIAVNRSTSRRRSRALGVEDGDTVRVTSRRGSIEAPVMIDRSLRAGVVFMTLHFPDDVATNLLTINATDPRSGTAEFKACAVRVDPVRKEPKLRAHREMPVAAAGDD